MLALETLERWILEERRGGRRDPLAAFRIAILVGRLVRVELDPAGREQGAIDVLRARPRSEIGETPEGGDVDVEPTADDRCERRRAVGPLHHVPRLGERASPSAFEWREEHRRRERRHDVGHDLAGVAACEHGILRVECRVELVCGHAGPPHGSDVSGGHSGVASVVAQARASRSTPERDARPTDLDLGEADPGSGQQILDQRLGNPVVLEVDTSAPPVRRRAWPRRPGAGRDSAAGAPRRSSCDRRTAP